MTLLFCARFLSAQVTGTLGDRLNTVFDSLCASHHLKGASAAIDITNVGYWTRCYGVSGATSPVRSDMIFSLGSNTKTYTATVMLRLHQDGLLSIKDTIGTWFPNVKNIPGSIRIDQLLQHTSGIASYTASSDFWNSVFSNPAKKWKPEEILPYIDTPEFKAGTDWSYSNSNFLLAGIIITKVTQGSLSAAYHKYIFAPLQLSNTFLATEETASDEFAHRWTVQYAPPVLVDYDATGSSYDGMNSVSWAAGGLYATAEDNVKFFSGLCRDKLLLADTMFIKMRTFKNLGGGFGYGFGLMSYSGFNGRTVYSHGGTNYGAINENIYDPLGRYSISVLTNQDSVSNNTLLTEVVLNLHKELILQKAGVDAVEKQDAFRLFPNPAHGKIFIQSGAHLPANSVLEIYQLNGEKMMSASLHQSFETLDLSLDPGIYYYRITGTEGRVQTGKLFLNP